MKHERMVHTGRLRSAGANFNIVWEARLYTYLMSTKQAKVAEKAYPHCRVENAGDLVVLFQPGAASEDLWKPELTDSTFHVADFALRRRRCFDPL